MYCPELFGANPRHLENPARRKETRRILKKRREATVFHPETRHGKDKSIMSNFGNRHIRAGSTRPAPVCFGKLNGEQKRALFDIMPPCPVGQLMTNDMVRIRGQYLEARPELADGIPNAHTMRQIITAAKQEQGWADNNLQPVAG